MGFVEEDTRTVHSSVEHILWEYPRFQVWRQEWQVEMLNRTHWPKCAFHALSVLKVSLYTCKQNGPPFRPKLLTFCLPGWPCVGIRNSTLHSLKAMLSLTLYQTRIKGFTYPTHSNFSCFMMLTLLTSDGADRCRYHN